MLNTKSQQLIRKAISIVTLLVFLFGQTVIPAVAGAQVLPATVSVPEGFQPTVLLGLKIHPENPLLFDFIVDRGQSKLNDEEFKAETQKLVKYFLAALTIPDKDSWVNLSPYEANRIIPDALGQTQMGKAMLEQDYILKQLAASLTNPETELGKKYWEQVNGARTLDARRLTLEKTTSVQPPTTSVSSNIFRTAILPAIEKEVNEGKDFVAVRQVYNSVILAAWYKQALKESLLGKVYMDKAKVAGVETDDKQMKERVYQQYLEAFKKGAYNFIKEEEDASGELIPRKYFSGGIATEFDASSALVRDHVSSSTIENKLTASASTIAMVTVLGDEQRAASTVEDTVNEPELISRIDFLNLNAQQNDLGNFGEALRNFKDVNETKEEKLRDQVLAIGESLRLHAHGVESTKRGIKGIINIALEGRLRFGAYSGLLRGGNAEYFSGPHGPYYAVLAGNSLTRGTQEDFRYFLFPDLKDKAYALAVVKAAADQGVITAEYADSIESKMITYEEFINLYRPGFSAEFLNEPNFKLTQLEKVYLRYFAGEMAVMLAQVHYLNHSQGEIHFSGKHFVATIEQKNYELDRTNQLFEEAVNKVFAALQENPQLAKKHQKEIAEVFANYFWQVYHLPKMNREQVDPDVDLSIHLGIRGIQRLDNKIAIFGAGLQGFVAMTEYPDKDFLLVDQNPFIVAALRKYRELTTHNSQILDTDFTLKDLIDENSLTPTWDRVILSRVLHEAGRTDVVPNGTEGNREDEINIASPEAQQARGHLIKNATALLRLLGTVVVREVLDSDEMHYAKTLLEEIKETLREKPYIVKLNVGETSVPGSDGLTQVPVAGIVGTIQRAASAVNSPVTTSASTTITSEPTTPVSGLDRQVGGIDFDPTLLNLQIKRDGKGVPLPLPEQNIENINIDGLYPVIINIQPVNAQTLPLLLGQKSFSDVNAKLVGT